MKTTSKTSSIAGSVSCASPSTSSAQPSRPASAMLRRQASIFFGSASSESTRPPRWRTPAVSQIVAYPREPPISSTSQSVCGATSEKRKRPVVGATARERADDGSPCSRSAASSASSRARTARTLSSSTGARRDLQQPEAHLVGRAFAPEDVSLQLRRVVAARHPHDVAGVRIDRVLEVVRVLPVKVPVRDVEQRVRVRRAGIELELDVDAAKVHMPGDAVDPNVAIERPVARGRRRRIVGLPLVAQKEQPDGDERRVLPVL